MGTGIVNTDGSLTTGVGRWTVSHQSLPARRGEPSVWPTCIPLSSRVDGRRRRTSALSRLGPPLLALRPCGPGVREKGRGAPRGCVGPARPSTARSSGARSPSSRAGCRPCRVSTPMPQGPARGGSLGAHARTPPPSPLRRESLDRCSQDPFGGRGLGVRAQGRRRGPRGLPAPFFPPRPLPSRAQAHVAPSTRPSASSAPGTPPRPARP